MTVVADVMTRTPVTATEDTPLREAAKRLYNRRISALPVCQDGALMGLVSEFDLLAAPPEARTVGDVMTREVITVSDDTTLDEVRAVLVKHRIRRVPVVDTHGQLLGIVSRSDLVRELATTWICQVCGDYERTPDPPSECPKCGTPSGYELAPAPPVGEGAEHDTTCPTCGQRLPESR